MSNIVVEATTTWNDQTLEHQLGLSVDVSAARYLALLLEAVDDFFVDWYALLAFKKWYRSTYDQWSGTDPYLNSTDPNALPTNWIRSYRELARRSGGPTVLKSVSLQSAGKITLDVGLIEALESLVKTLTESDDEYDELISAVTNALAAQNQQAQDESEFKRALTRKVNAEALTQEIRAMNDAVGYFTSLGFTPKEIQALMLKGGGPLTEILQVPRQELKRLRKADIIQDVDSSLDNGGRG